MELQDLLKEEKKVHVKLYARCLVDNEVREKGDIVEVAEICADSFGERVPVKKAEK